MGKLVLTRKVGESFIIEMNGEKVLEITYQSHSGEQIRVSFEAGQEISIYRDEVYERILTERLKKLKE